VFYPPAAFGQSNIDLFERLLAQIHAGVPRGRDVVELYAGSGAIGLGLAASCRSIVFNEIGAASLAGLALGLDALPPDERQRCRVVPGAAEAAKQEISSDRIVIVDPPRKGLDPGVVEALTRARPERIAYVSCGLGSFLRDADALIRGGLELEATTLYDLFPFTAHVETLAWFRRATAR
jgi:23S rRNA (uracil1939-C5)-methyltransferase